MSSVERDGHTGMRLRDSDLPRRQSRCWRLRSWSSRAQGHLPSPAHALDSASLLPSQVEAPVSLPHGDIPATSPLLCVLLCGSCLLWRMLPGAQGPLTPLRAATLRSGMKTEHEWPGFSVPAAPASGACPYWRADGDTAYPAQIPEASPGPQ